VALATKYKKSTYNSEEPRDEGGDEILAGPGADNGVVGPGHGRPVVSRDHQAHLQELARVRRQPAYKVQFLGYAGNTGRIPGTPEI
jgi:hypothetical protein